MKDWDLLKFAALTSCSKSSQGKMDFSASKTIKVTTSATKTKHWLGKVTARLRSSGSL